MASTSFKLVERFSIPAIKNTSFSRAPDFKRKTAKILQSPKPLRTSQPIRLAEIYKTQIQRDATQPAGFDVTDTQILLLWGKLWNSSHNNTLKMLPGKSGHFKRDSQHSLFLFSALFYAPVGAVELAFVYCSPPTESSPWEICPLSYHLLGNRHLWWSESQWWRTHFKRNAFKIHSHRWKTGLLSNSGNYINKAHGSVTDINRKCMHKIYSRWQSR